MKSKKIAFPDVKVGDTVIVEERKHPYHNLYKFVVTKVTPKQFEATRERGPNTPVVERFYREDGRLVGEKSSERDSWRVPQTYAHEATPQMVEKFEADRLRRVRAAAYQDAIYKLESCRNNPRVTLDGELSEALKKVTERIKAITGTV